jgi:hypothetical protein
MFASKLTKHFNARSNYFNMLSGFFTLSTLKQLDTALYPLFQPIDRLESPTIWDSKFKHD